MIKRVLFFLMILLGGTLSTSATTFYAKASGNWNATTTWGTSCGGGSLVATTPTTGDIVYICSSYNVTITTANAYCATLNVTGGTLTFQSGNALTVSGDATFSSGTSLQGTSGNFYLTVGGTISFTNTTVGSGTTGNFDITAADILIPTGSGFYGASVELIKSGGTANIWPGGNTFGASATGTTITLVNNSTYDITMANTSADTYNCIAEFQITSSGKIYPAKNGANSFAGNIKFACTGTGGIYFCSGTGTAQLASARQLNIGGQANFTQGVLHFRNFNQLGTTTMTAFDALDTGSGELIFENCTFNGQFSATWPYIKFDRVSFPTNCNQTFQVTNIVTNSKATGTGGNRFGSPGSTSMVTFKNNGRGTWTIANTTRDTCYSNVTYTVDADYGYSGAKIVACNQVGNIYNGNIELNSEGTDCGYWCFDEVSGITIEGSSSAHVTLASTKTISAGGGGIKDGTIFIKYFDQLGTTTQAINTSCQNLKEDVYAELEIYNSTWASNSFSTNICEGIISGCYFNGTFTMDVVQTSGWSIYSRGNTFNGAVIMNNPTVDNFGCTYGYKMATTTYFSHTTADTYNGTLTAGVTGAYSSAYFSCTGATTYPQNISVTVQGGDSDINFGPGGTSSLSTGRTISIGTLSGGSYACSYGTWIGYLNLNKFTQVGTTTQTLTGNTNCQINLTDCIFNGNVLSFEASMFNLKNTKFKGATSTTFTQTGSGSSYCLTNGYVKSSDCYGGNRFYAANTYLTSNSKFYLGMAISANDTIDGNVIVENTTQQASCSLFPSGILFGAGGAYAGSEAGSGKTYLAHGKAVMNPGGTTFDEGRLFFKNFIQGTTTTGAAAQSWTLTADAEVRFETGSIFYGVVTSNSPHVYFNGSTFENTATFTRTNPTSGNHEANNSKGGCTFKGTTTIINNTSGTVDDSMSLATVSADTYQGNVTFTDNENKISPAKVGINNFGGNITMNGTGTNVMQFGLGGGTVSFNGTGNQTVIRTGSVGVPSIKNLTVNKSAGILDFTTGTSASVTQVNVTGVLTLTDGKVKTDSTSQRLVCWNGSTCNGGSATSYVYGGPLRKKGNNAFVFPVGCISPNNRWARCELTPNSATLTSDDFSVQYYQYTSAPSHIKAANMGTGLTNVSAVEYWQITKNNSNTPTYNVKLYWQDNSTNTTTGSGIINTPMTDLVVAHWNSSTSKWENMSQATVPTFGTSGSVNSGPISSFSPFAFGSRGASGWSHPLPIELISFTGEVQGVSNLLKWTTASEYNNDYFTVEKSQDGKLFSDLTEVDGAGNSTEEINYDYLDETPYDITYYRLRQTDYSGNKSYSQIIPLSNINIGKVDVNFSPNPGRSGESINMTINGILQNNTINYTVYNSLGQKINEGQLKHDGKYSVHNINNLSGLLAPGNYTINVVIDNKNYKNNIIIR